MNDEQQRGDVVRYWWDKAQKCIASAEREREAGALGFAVNRLYYAAFYAVSAALFERRLAFRKHAGVRSTFHREFVKARLLDAAWGKLYDQLFDDRQEGDYVALVEFDEDYVDGQLSRCRQFLQELRPLISSLSEDG